MRVYFYRPKIRKMSAYVQHHERITTRIAFSGNAMIVEDFSGSLFHYDLSDVAESPRRTP
ncbi:MAG: hypothetical protein QG650_141 [Patescibacteria group bacterium]|nr:hypothetical protein [Patescibacteria group bacterium]